MRHRSRPSIFPSRPAALQQRLSVCHNGHRSGSSGLPKADFSKTSQCRRSSQPRRDLAPCEAQRRRDWFVGATLLLVHWSRWHLVGATATSFGNAPDGQRGDFLRTETRGKHAGLIDGMLVPSCGPSGRSTRHRENFFSMRTPVSSGTILARCSVSRHSFSKMVWSTNGNSA